MNNNTGFLCVFREFCVDRRGLAQLRDFIGNPAHALSRPNHSRETAIASPVLRHQCAESNGSPRV